MHFTLLILWQEKQEAKMRIEIKSFDTLFFRDGKPFTMSEDNWADGIFPPPPSVIYGALRAAYFAQYPSELVRKI